MIFSESRKPTVPGWVWVELYGAALPVLFDGVDEVCVWSPSGTMVASSVHKDMRFGDLIKTPVIEPNAYRMAWWKRPHFWRGFLDWKPWALGMAIGAVLVIIFGCNATEPVTPVCCESGFSPTTGRDSSWVTPCSNN